jgi:hypothetical protein
VIVIEDDEEDEIQDAPPPPPKPQLPICTGISKSSKKHCKNKVSLLGQTKCPLHGGMTKNRTAMKKRREPIPWPLINSACIGYLINDHAGSGCKCLSKDGCLRHCKTVQVIVWLHTLATYISSRKGSARSSYPTPGALTKWLEDTPGSMSNEAILEKARSLLGMGNVGWLSTLIPVRRRRGGDDDEVEEVEEEEEPKKPLLKKKIAIKPVKKPVKKDKEEEDDDVEDVEDEEPIVDDDVEEGDEEEEASAMHVSDEEEYVGDGAADDANENGDEGVDEDDENDDAEKPRKPAGKKAAKRAKTTGKDVEEEHDSLESAAKASKKHAVGSDGATAFATQMSPAV